MKTTTIHRLAGARRYQALAPSLCLCGLLLLCALALTSGTAYAAELDQPIQLDIPAHTPLDQALIEWGKRTGMQVMIATHTVAQLTTEGVKGTLSARAALESLLKGSGLTYSAEGNAVTVSLASNRNRTSSNVEPLPLTSDVASVSKISSEEESTTASRTSGRNRGVEELQEIIVTGTHIRGVESASPILVYTADQIARSGYTTTQQFLASLPVNAGGGATEQTANAISSGANFNIPAETSPNLHGLGSQATLTLINGQRLAAAGYGTYTDISMIPLMMIDRIEILTDGASALYGSEAVAGVVNVILKRSLAGAETSMSYGGVTDGSLRQVDFSQAAGGTWNQGGGLLSYNFNRQTRLAGSDRDFIPVGAIGADLLPATKRQSLFGTVHDDITNAVGVYTDVLYSHRVTDTVDVLQIANNDSSDQYSIVGGGHYKVTDSWALNISGNWGENHLLDRGSSQGILDVSATTRSTVWSATALASGDLFPINGQSAKLAIGGEYRTEAFHLVDNLGNSSDVNVGRRVEAAFSELNLPLFGDGEPRLLIHELTVTAAMRYEHYSDFGNTTNTKFGLRWKPMSDVTLRATTGTAFRAPALTSIATPSQAIIFPLPDPLAVAGSTTSLLLLGAKANLEPETARSTTVGVEYQPAAVPSLAGSVTLFRTNYRGKLQTPSGAPFGILSDPQDFGSLIIRNPQLNQVTDIIATSNEFINPFGLPPSAVAAIVDDRFQNIAAVEVRGWDLQLAYTRPTSAGIVGIDLSAEHLSSFTQRITPSAPSVDLVNSVYNPPHFRARADASLASSQFTLSGAVNYVGGYINNQVLPDAPVSAFITADLRVAYDFTDRVSPLLHGSELSVSVTNILDRQPPVIAGSLAGYDAVNASPLGRLVTAQLRKRW